MTGGNDGAGEWWRFECECGVRAPLAFSMKEARGFWNADNAEAQNTKRLTVAMDNLTAAICDLPTEMNGGCCPPGHTCRNCEP
jgi:hypothetical protein